jgi:protein O-mannosyl-transferase
MSRRGPVELASSGEVVLHQRKRRGTSLKATVDAAVRAPGVRGRLGWLPPAALVVIGLVVFSNSVSGPFIWDDRVAIVENASIAPPSGLSDAFRPPAENPMTGRPLVNASLALNYRLGGLHPFGYHVWNILTHIAAALFLFGVVRRTLLLGGARDTGLSSPATSMAFLCAGLWMIHPLQTEVVDYVTQRTESMAGLFVLAAVYAALRDTHATHAWRWRVAAIAACAAGMACKESAAVAPVLILLYDAAFRGPSVVTALRRRRAFYAGLALTWLVFGGLLLSRLGSNSAGFGGGIDPFAYALNQAPLILTYLKLAIVPFPLVLDYGPAVPTTTPSNWAALAIVALIVAGVIASWWRARRLAFLGSWFFVTLAPSSSVVPVFTEVGAERRVYLALAAVVVLAVAGVRWFAQRYAPQQAGTAAPVILCGIATVFSVLTWQRNAVYADPIHLWESVVQARPHCRAHVNLGVLLKDAGRRDEAIAEFRSALDGCPEAHYSLALEAEADRQFAEAEHHYREYVRLRYNAVDVARAHKLLGRLLRRQRRLPEAEAEFRTAIRIVADDPDAHAGLADVLFDANQLAAATEEYRRALALRPANAMAHGNLALALMRQGLAAEALAEFRLAAQAAPSDPRAHQNLATALMSLQRPDEGIVEYRRAIALGDGNPAAHAGLALALAEHGRVPEALPEFRRALELNPGDAALQAAYEQYLKPPRRR